MSPQVPYHLGCPVFASPEWLGKLFTSKARRADWLRQYSSVFNTVEGNSTFYGLPTAETVRRWANSSEPGFRFALKFPRSISHEKELLEAQAETYIFLDVLGVLHGADRLGPSMLQLGPRFDGSKFGQLSAYLRALPPEFPYAVEVRHPDYFDEGRMEQALNALLSDLGMNRVLFDSRPLFSRSPRDDFEAKAQSEKPRPPIRRTVTALQPVIRLIGNNSPAEVLPWICEWTPTVANWIKQGLTPYVFTHAPHDLHAPSTAQLFHRQLQRELPKLADLPVWPAEEEARERARQRKLFF